MLVSVGLNGVPNLECVLPFGIIVAATPDVAVANAIKH
ncbi:hypothetical protein COLO4_01392 [Corchorus olitorius]|uniref:Uncharacterized protein n=1 Tax=Corchorus olitorius TaxID=93759 RepID=A0A1R3L2J0_9ROSI|nr:hypothetical protein COLO4_01392 [Corchorus olitorius]